MAPAVHVSEGAAFHRASRFGHGDRRGVGAAHVYCRLCGKNKKQLKARPEDGEMPKTRLGARRQELAQQHPEPKQARVLGDFEGDCLKNSRACIWNVSGRSAALPLSR